MARPNNGPKLGKNPAGFWEIKWSDSGRSRRESTGTADKGQAEIALADWLHARGKTKPGEVPTVRAVLVAYAREVLAATASAGRSEYAVTYLTAAMGELCVSALSAERIATYLSARQSGAIGARPAVPATVRRELIVLIAAINHARKQRRIDGASVPHIDLPADSAPKSSCLSSAQLDALHAQALKECEGKPLSRIARFIFIASETAARRRSIETLTWGQVDLPAGIIHFQEDGKTHAIKRRVAVPISSRLLPVLKRAFSEWEMLPKGGAALVLDTDGEIASAWTALMGRMHRLTGDESFLSFTPHDLRRTWATLAARNGVSMFDISGVLGDSLPIVTKHYAHHSPGHLRAAIDHRAPALA